MSNEQEQQPPQDVHGTANVTGDNPGYRCRNKHGHDYSEHPPPAPTAAPIAIPAPVGDFTGREQELADLAAALSAGTGAAITGVRGMGGIGKSQLAFKVAHALKPHYPKQVMVTLRQLIGGSVLVWVVCTVILLTYPTPPQQRVGAQAAPTAAATQETVVSQAALRVFLPLVLKRQGRETTTAPTAPADATYVMVN
ncbi:hypothetical protein HC928_16100 [bacterium]|nr:hypothetical protein [bacterium]